LNAGAPTAAAAAACGICGCVYCGCGRHLWVRGSDGHHQHVWRPNDSTIHDDLGLPTRAPARKVREYLSARAACLQCVASPSFCVEARLLFGLLSSMRSLLRSALPYARLCSLCAVSLATARQAGQLPTDSQRAPDDAPRPLKRAKQVRLPLPWAYCCRCCGAVPLQARTH
jgi:hypothetical protein